MIRSIPSTRGAAGFSLIEIMIAIVVLSIGLLGFGMMLAFSVQANQSANHRTEATNLSYEIIDRIRANRPNAGAYSTTYATGAGSTSGSTRARTDLREWKQRLEAMLPGGQAQVTVANGVVTVDIRWTDARWEDVAANATTTFSVTSQI